MSPLSWEQAWVRDQERNARAGWDEYRSQSPNAPPWEQVAEVSKLVAIHNLQARGRYRQAYLAGQASMVDAPAERDNLPRWCLAKLVYGRVFSRITGRTVWWGHRPVESERVPFVEDRYAMSRAADRSGMWRA